MIQKSPTGRIPQPPNIPISDKLYINLYDYYCPVDIPFRIPAGWINDGASSPRLGYFIIRPDGLVRAGALVHDFICEHDGHFTAQLQNGLTVDLSFTWAEAATLFHKINLASGLSSWRCNLAYEGVSMWGLTKGW
jgi:hypothetical protein